MDGVQSAMRLILTTLASMWMAAARFAIKLTLTMNVLRAIGIPGTKTVIGSAAAFATSR